MRASPTKEHFINQAPTITPTVEKNKEDLHIYVKNSKQKWPFFEKQTKGSGKFLVTLSVSIPEEEFNAVAEHVTALGVSKREWLRECFARAIREEQEYCKNKEMQNGI